MPEQTYLSRPGLNVVFRIGVCLLVLAIGVVGMMKLASLKTPPTKKTSREKPLQVEVLRVQPEEVPIVLTGYGEVTPLDVVSITPEVSGRIIEINPDLEPGEVIAAGENLFSIDPINYQAAVQEAEAAVEGVIEVGMPVTAAVITTIVAFTPLLYIGGIMGKFISILPVVVIACLLISLVECLILLPAHLNDLPEMSPGPTQKGSAPGRLTRFHESISSGLEWFVQRIYRPFLRKAIRWRYISMCTAFSILFLAVGLIQGGILKFEIFPDIDGFVITSVVKFPEGTPVEVTQEAVDQIDGALLRLAEKTETLSGAPLIENRLSLVGRTLQEIPDSGPNVGSVQAILLPSEKRGIHSKDLMVAWEQEIGTIPGVKSLTFEGLQAGPPGAPIEVWIQGFAMESILGATDTLIQRLQAFDGVYQIRSDFSPGKQEIRLELKPEARTLGLTVSDLARQVYAGYYGEEALRLQRGEHDIRVKIRYTQQERSTLSNLDQVRIRTPGGQEVPLLSVANVSFGPGYSTITRTDGMRRVAVSADIDSKRANANEIFTALTTDFFPDLQDKYPGIYVAPREKRRRCGNPSADSTWASPWLFSGSSSSSPPCFAPTFSPLSCSSPCPSGSSGLWPATCSWATTSRS